MKKEFDRRTFLKQAGSTALGASALSWDLPSFAESVSPADRPDAGISFQSEWAESVQRPWPGPEYWANPMQDWQVSRGRLECHSPGGDRNVVLLTRDVAARDGNLVLDVHMGRIGDAAPTEGFAGFRVGIKQPLGDYRATALYGQGMNAGIDAGGRLFIGGLQPSASRISLDRIALDGELHLHLQAQRSASGYAVLLRATSLQGNHSVEITRDVPVAWITGGVALVCSSGPVLPTPTTFPDVKDFSFYPPHQQGGGTMRFWFKDWTVGGSKVDAHDERAYGPILFTLYTVSRGVLKLSAQFPPLDNDAAMAALEVKRGGRWQQVATASLDKEAWNATFRVAAWDAGQDCDYRVGYRLADANGEGKQYFYTGTIRKDPVEKPNVVVGLLTCVWDFGFPHVDFTTNLAAHQPDILFWTGDQVYEPVGGFGAIESREPDQIAPAMLDFLRKWLVFGWAVRDLTRDIPSVCMTDDHDMYHGNIWGCGGRPTNPALGSGAATEGTVVYGPKEFAIQDSGGYKMAPRWVNMVQRLQTAHLPDPFDATPVLQGIGVYYCDLRWGGVSFAILEDRKWKSAPRPLLPGAEIVNGYRRNLGWSSEAASDDPEAELLGQRQLDFLEAWAADWGGGTWMKLAVSQTPFGCIHTEPKEINDDSKDPEESIPPVGTYVEGDHLVADYDSNAWPQHGRDAGILKFRKAFAPHLSGDQHLGSTFHYGVDDFRDGVYGICTPAISSIWPRRWWPPHVGVNPLPGSRNTGDYFDAFGNRLTILATANPARYPGDGLEGLRLRATGYSIVTCERATRKTTATLWPRWVDPTAPGAKPYAGWPMTIDQTDNGLWGAQWALNPIETPDFADPVVQVQDEVTREVVYTLRIHGKSFTPRVRKPGVYRVLAYDPDGFYRKEWESVQARRINSSALDG